MKSPQEVYLTTVDKIKIAINHYQSEDEQVLIIAPGWTMSKDSKFIRKIARNFTEFFDVISIDFRGHGKSSGLYTFTSKESNDLNAVVNYAKNIYKKVYLMGFSLGGAISIIHSARNKNVDMLIAVSAPHSFAKIRHFGWVKDFLTNKFNKYEFRILRTLRPNLLIKKKIRPIDVAGMLDIPTLFIAGESDSIICLTDTKSLFDKATCQKSFEMFKNCNHAEDLIHQDEDKFVKICANWFTKS
jgi:pimeloyl-ACP methyl ester carboxylesterase